MNVCMYVGLMTNPHHLYPLQGVVPQDRLVVTNFCKVQEGWRSNDCFLRRHALGGKRTTQEPSSYRSASSLLFPPTYLPTYLPTDPTVGFATYTRRSDLRVEGVAVKVQAKLINQGQPSADGIVYIGLPGMYM